MSQYASLPLPARNVSPDPSGVPFAKTLVLSPPLAAGARRRALSDPLGNSETFQHYRQVAAHSPGYVMRPSGPKLTHSRPESRQEVLKQSPSYSQCSYCAAVSKQLALLSPCTHALCPPCLTSALNIVDQVPIVGTFDLNLGPLRPSHPSTNNEDVVVLRIDNIPWTITPPAILSFLGVPSSPRCPRSHPPRPAREDKVSCIRRAASSAVAGAVLRGEHRATPKLGDGRRARDRPFLTGGASPGTHTCNSELTVLISLIRNPNPRFVKTPSLPFYLLTSMLSKIPADGDCHLLWTGSGILYDITITAIQVLLARELEAVDRVLFQDLVGTALSCRAFTADQLSGLSGLLLKGPCDVSRGLFGVVTEPV
ncbi:hypothetical protein B0H14DRAFT_3010567 [Mycena olivaceomarginata]|nr:hypothetical protein B0H14DRAFT_3010567 [Mycena olivaceomarginata]